MISSERVRRTVVGVIGALLLAVAFPRVGAAWCAPLGAAALFWSWQGASWRAAFARGWLAGLVFFTISFWWWSNTIQADVGVLAYVAVVAAAALEALTFGAAGALAVVAHRRAPAALAPLAAAAAFAALEWMRSIGTLGVPFAQLGTTQADTALRVLAAYVGTNGVTLAICIVAAYAADAFERRSWRACALAAASVVAATVVAWLAWPARSVPPPTIPVAAVQGNIAQTLKWQPGALQEAIARYTQMTATTDRFAPRLIVWPETVIADRYGLNRDPQLLARFARLAADAHGTIIAGSIDVHAERVYNGLYFIDGSGLQTIYDKRQLVPFAESFPGHQFLWWLPYVGELSGNFTPGTDPGVYPTQAGLRVGPMICWESAFGDLGYQQVRDGAQLLVISTDDAWFGTTSGPYQHAQIAQMRAVEFGTYVVRAAATGISGIIAPDGRWQTKLPLETQGVVEGRVGPPVGSVFAHIGPTNVWLATLALYALLVLVARRGRDA
ncbi:MAG: apolipoprotein N-acyltransferase [bacterium]|nr:apolipoprotein N-acyltransferase [bacterium]